MARLLAQCTLSVERRRGSGCLLGRTHWGDFAVISDFLFDL